jgi:phthalate 4,5-dioxygenase oxygenase subunit
MLTREENELLTRTGPGTPVGALFRRYWLPALLSAEVPEPDGDPIKVRLLGEDLVAFRDTRGRVGLMEEYCPHRQASLVYGRNEECGLRCIYHGWKVDVDGNILETPPEPPESTFKDRLKHVAYPTFEAQGVVWAYLGPREHMSPPPDWEWMHAPAEQFGVTKLYEDCNYLQGAEGSIDSAHSDYLHSSNIAGRPRDHSPRLETQDTAYGFRYAAIRRPDTDPDKQKYVRVTIWVAPCHVLIPPLRPRVSGSVRDGEEVAVHQAWVPMDDEHNAFFSFAYNRNGPLPPAWREHAEQFGLDRPWGWPQRNRRNLHLQDRTLMRQGHWSGIEGVNCQDFTVVESMGPIIDRTREHLGASDVAVIRMRRRMLDAVRAFQAGGQPLGLDPSIPYGRIATDERIIPIDQPWQSVAAFAGESVPDAVPARA